MRKVAAVFVLFIFTITPALSQPARATDKALVYFVAEANYLDTICGSKAINKSKMNSFLSISGMKPADLEEGGPLNIAYIVGGINAGDKFSGLSIAGACHHLKEMFGEEGTIFPGMLE